jgi:hypothetical protein
MNAPKIELRNIKHTAWASEETHCYQASLYVDGTKWGLVGNDGHGGADFFYGADGKTWSDIAKLNERIASTVPPYEYEGRSLPYDLEMLCSERVSAWLMQRDFDRAMKSKVLFTKPDTAGVWQVPIKKPQTMWMVLDSMKAKFPEYTYLADLPRSEALALYSAV